MPQLRWKILPAADKTGCSQINQLNKKIFLSMTEVPRKRKCNYIKCSIKQKKRTGKGWKVKIRIKTKRALCPRGERRCGQVGLLGACSPPGRWTAWAWLSLWGGIPRSSLPVTHSMGSRCRGSVSSHTPQPSPHLARAQAPPCPTVLQALGSGRPAWTGWAAGVWLGQSHQLQEQTGRKTDANRRHKKLF